MDERICTLGFDFDLIDTITLHYSKYDADITTLDQKIEVDEEPETLLIKIKDDNYEYKNRMISKINFFDEDCNLIHTTYLWTNKQLIDFLSKYIFLDADYRTLHEGDAVEFINSGLKGTVNRMGVGKTNKLISVMVKNHVYTALPQNIRKIHQSKLNEEKAKKIDLLNAPYFIKIDIEGRCYSYACFDEVKVGDYVMVSGRAEAMIHKVREVIPNNKMQNKNIVTQEVKCVCNFDTSAYEKRVRDRVFSDFKKECSNFLKNVNTLEKCSVLQVLLTDKISILKEKK